MSGSQQEVEDVLAYFEHWLRQGMFAQADELLQIMLIDKVEPATLLATLSITYPAKDKLKHRETFLERAEAQLVAKLGAERATALLEHRR